MPIFSKVKKIYLKLAHWSKRFGGTHKYLPERNGESALNPSYTFEISSQILKDFLKNEIGASIRKYCHVF